MTTNANNILVGTTGTVSVAPTGTTGPTTTSTALAAGFVDLGFLTEEGFTFTESKDIADILVWQSFYPARRLVTGRSVQVSFSLREWKTDTIEFALGGTVTGSAPNWKYTPPTPSDIGEKSLVIDWQDGTRYFRLYFPTGIVTEAVESNFTRTDSSVLPVTFSGLDPGGSVSIYTLFTNDTSFSS